MRNRTLPTFTSPQEWQSYQKILICRLNYLKDTDDSTDYTAKISGHSADEQTVSVASWLSLLAEWLDAFGINLDWLFETENTSLPLMQPDKHLSPTERKELSIICERLIRKLNNTRVR